MGGSDSKIETSNISQSTLRTQQPLPTKYVPPFRKFGDLFRKRNGSNKTFVLSVRQPYQEQISLETPVYQDLQEAFHTKTQDIIIQNVINDQQISQRWVFQTISGSKKQSLIIRPFSTQQSHMYANILCQVHFAQAVTQLNSQNLLNLTDNYVVQTGIDCIDDPNSHILVMESVDANLSQIIRYRRSNHWDWTVAQFNRFMSDLVNGLSDLHAAGISHNDIRPANIYFSIKKNCYVLGNYSNCQKGQGNVSSSNARADNRFSAPQTGHKHQINLLKGDVYSLGLTLLSAFYLCQHIDKKLLNSQNIKLLESRYEPLKIIELMLAPVDSRYSIAEIKAKLPASTFKYQSMAQLIDSMQHKERPSTEEAASAKLATGWAYQRLGLWNQWKKDYEEALELLEHNSTPAGKAGSLMQLAIIDHCRGQLQSTIFYYIAASNYAKSAAGIYRSLGAAELELGVHGAAESYYKKAIGCSKYYQFQNDIDLSRSLQGISRVHAERNQYKLARTLAVTASNVASKQLIQYFRSNGKDSFEWAEIRVDQAKIQTQFGSFEQANKILEDSLIVADRKQGINPQKSQLLRAKIFAQKGRNWIKWAQKQQTQQKRTKMLDLANTDLIKGVNIYQSIEQDHHNDLAYIVKHLGQVQFKRQAYDQAIKDYDRGLNLINFVQIAEGKKKKQKGQLLCLKGTSNSFKGDMKQALKNYEEGLEIYRQIYGSDHNRHSAIAIGNLGRVYINAGSQEKARDCLKISCDILSDIGGLQDADYLHFKAVENNLHQYIP